MRCLRRTDVNLLAHLKPLPSNLMIICLLIREDNSGGCSRMKGIDLGYLKVSQWTSQCYLGETVTYILCGLRASVSSDPIKLYFETPTYRNSLLKLVK